MQEYDAKLVPVLSTDETDRVNRAIAIPETIRTNDGRELRIVDWEPEVKLGEAVRVNLRAIVYDLEITPLETPNFFP